MVRKKREMLQAIVLLALALGVRGDNVITNSYSLEMNSESLIFPSALISSSRVSPMTSTSPSNPTTPLTTTSIFDPSKEAILYIAVGCACGVTLIITSIILIICIVVWKKKLEEVPTDGRAQEPVHRKTYRKNNANVRIDQLELNEEVEETEDERMKRMPIPISEFSESVKKKHFNANIAFEDEFESLPVRHTSTYTVAKAKNNETKNRFENIFPYDFSRVILKHQENKQEADYINASFINGYNRENGYIAAQGPLRNTLADFWRMIWEHRLSAIIMLTETVEAGREKCVQYWPALMDTSWNVGDNLSVTLQVQTQYAAYRVKQILLENTAEVDSEPINVTHFHFSAWPDHGVPADKTCLIQFIQRVRKEFPYYDSPPLIVHCSAGVGRSGTFIALDSMLQRMKVENSLDIYPFVIEMRKKRALMVQTEAQYSFIHDALEEFITCGDTSIAVTNIRVAMVNLGKRESNGQNGYNAQFTLLEEVSHKKTAVNCNEAEKDYNKEKNRYPDMIPYNINRVYLRPGGARGSDYINASFVDGYKHRRNFIAAQCPLENTVNDFWRMVWEHKNHVIVMLCNLDGDDVDKQERCHKYWPNVVNRANIYGRYKVKMLQEEENTHFVMRKFEVGEDSPYIVPDKLCLVQGTPDSVTVTQFHHTKWPMRGEVPSSASILEMINSLLKIQMSTGNHAIVVVCNDGSGRTGTFTTIYSQIERIKAEQVADIFQYIKGVRFQRADMVYEEAQFRFCHQVLADYLNSVDNYANFKDLC